MRYVITQPWLGFDHEIEITKDDFEILKEARNRTLLLSSLEDKFMLLLENYEELEQEMIRLSLHRMIYMDNSMPALIDNIRLLNRRFANFLTTARLYKDHSAHDVSTFFGKVSKQFTDHAQLHSSHYDKKLGYRAMEAARNFLQHRSLLIHGTLHQAKHVEGEGRVVHSGMINMSVRKLREEGGFKSSVLSELEVIADEKGNVDIRPLVREYMASLGEAHVELRKMLENDAQKFESIIVETIQRLNDVSDINHSSVYVSARNEEGKSVDDVPLLRDFAERRRRIIIKTQHITHYAMNYVSNK